MVYASDASSIETQDRDMIDTVGGGSSTENPGAENEPSSIKTLVDLDARVASLIAEARRKRLSADQRSSLLERSKNVLAGLDADASTHGISQTKRMIQMGVILNYTKQHAKKAEGGWTRWVEREISSIGQRMCQTYMQVARCDDAGDFDFLGIKRIQALGKRARKEKMSIGSFLNANGLNGNASDARLITGFKRQVDELIENLRRGQAVVLRDKRVKALKRMAAGFATALNHAVQDQEFVNTLQDAERETLRGIAQQFSEIKTACDGLSDRPTPAESEGQVMDGTLEVDENGDEFLAEEMLSDRAA